ncbi:stage II sporulation protein R [Amphibacillus cookii]|uniref:stage II sporulation protein R n=1 Tax=Amphibacillus cookii TaxID=767787 RepID=UPI00195B19B9|nr:stage II sporulation protein R [Amphibacillus cookii]MBM7540830.1 stage II sporulation protein R [Amphibacillus cookii]
MPFLVQAIITIILSIFNLSTQLPLSDYQVIPDEAIRLRILAESDGEEDQLIKHQVRDAVNAEITEWVSDLTDIEAARAIIQDRLDDIEQIVATTLNGFDATMSYQVEYNDHVAFPAKLYDHYVYPAGEYEAILITLGEGQGSNWWCVLFPPLCFLDFSAGTTVEPEDTEDEQESVNVSFFFLEWFR